MNRDLCTLDFLFLFPVSSNVTDSVSFIGSFSAVLSCWWTCFILYDVGRNVRTSWFLCLPSLQWTELDKSALSEALSPTLSWVGDNLVNLRLLAHQFTVYASLMTLWAQDFVRVFLSSFLFFKTGLVFLCQTGSSFFSPGKSLSGNSGGYAEFSNNKNMLSFS